MRPELGSTALALYERLAQFHAHSERGVQVNDEELGWPLLIYWGSLAARWQEIEDLVRESRLGPGFSQILNIERIPAKGLPWVAQFNGVSFLPGMNEAEQRARATSTDGRKRGTVRALMAAAQRHLTGERVVVLQERYEGSAKRLGVVTYRRETPTPELTRQDIEEQLPWWIRLIYGVEEGWDYFTLRVEQPTYAAVRERYASYRNIREHI